MIELECREVIDRSIEEVFAYVADVTKQTEWSSAVQSVRLEELGPVECGTRYWQTVKMLGRQMEGLFEVSDYEPNRKIGLRNLTGPMPVTWNMMLEPVDGRTHIVAEVHAEPGPGFKLAEPLMKRAMRRQAAGDFATLRDLLEVPK